MFVLISEERRSYSLQSNWTTVTVLWHYFFKDLFCGALIFVGLIFVVECHHENETPTKISACMVM